MKIYYLAKHGCAPKLAFKSKTFSLLMLALITAASAFSPINIPVRSLNDKNIVLSSVKLCMSSSNNEEKAKEMENLIVSLSLEPTDESRRQRLALIFEEELAKPNGFPKDFTDSFGAALEVVGTQVQTVARETAMEMTKNKEESDCEEEEEGSSGEGKAGPEGRQLWALVDMMVQSKTILKKATGDLGSKGTFQ